MPRLGVTSNSGILQNSNGQSVIPSSTRADGSVRKEIRIKPGYRPPEDVEVYKNRTAEAWKNRGKGGVPGATDSNLEQTSSLHSTAANKNAKRREARKKAAAAALASDDSTVTGPEPLAAGSVEPEQKNVASVEPQEADSEAEKAKEARKLAKKLRQARELKEKKERGADLLPEQFARVIKISELVRQLDLLGFDHDGERKPPQEADELTNG